MSAQDVVAIAATGLIFWVLGQIWMAQIVTYPLFAFVGEREYRAYHAEYTHRIIWPIIVPGFASFLQPIVLAVWGPLVPLWITAGNLAAGIGSFLVTIGWAIPRHRLLETSGKNPEVIADLVRCNWPRTVAVTVQSGLTLAALAHSGLFQH